MGQLGGSRTGRLLVVVGAAIAVTLAVGASAASAASAADRRTVLLRTTVGRIGLVAMDGFKVAIAEGMPEGHPPFQCGRVDLVDVRGGPRTRLSPRDFMFYCDSGGVSGLAVAGSRAYWLWTDIGTSIYQTLLTGAPRSPERVLVPTPGRDVDLGPFLGPIAASGSSLAYSQWRRQWLPLGCDPFHGERCTLSAPFDITLTLRGAPVAVPSPGGFVASVDSGRAAVLLADGRVAVVRRTRPPVIVGPVPHATGPAAGAAIAGRWLVVLARRRLWAFDAATGRPHASWPATGATSVDVWNGIAVVTTRRQIVAVRLSNGHRRLIQQVGRGRGFTCGAQIEAGGIVWATEPTRAQALFHGLYVAWRLPLPALG